MSTKGAVTQQSCTITVAIPKKRIILHDALTEPGTLFTCKKTAITFLSDGDEFKEYAITCPNPLFDSTGIVLYLELETLAGMDSTAAVKILSFSIGNDVQDIEQVGVPIVTGVNPDARSDCVGKNNHDSKGAQDCFHG